MWGSYTYMWRPYWGHMGVLWASSEFIRGHAGVMNAQVEIMWGSCKLGVMWGHEVSCAFMWGSFGVHVGSRVCHVVVICVSYGIHVGSNLGVMWVSCRVMWGSCGARVGVAGVLCGWLGHVAECGVMCGHVEFMRGSCWITWVSCVSYGCQKGSCGVTVCVM